MPAEALEKTVSPCDQPSRCGLPPVLGQSAAQMQRHEPAAMHSDHTTDLRMLKPSPRTLKNSLGGSL